MAIRDVVTRGFGNGTYSGTIPLVVLRGYGSAEVVDVAELTTRLTLRGVSAERLTMQGVSEQRLTVQGTSP